MYINWMGKLLTQIQSCYLVPSSLVIPMTVSLQASRSLVSAHSSVSVQFVMALMSSSHRARGLPLFLAPPPIPNIIDFSKLFSLRMMCPKYDSCCFFISASSGLLVLISSITDLLVLLAVHGILSSLLQHHNSKLVYERTYPGMRLLRANRECPILGSL